MWLSNWLDSFAPYRDKWDYIFGIGFLVILSSTFFLDISDTFAVGVITAGTVFLAQYRLRHPNKEDIATVRPAFQSEEDAEPDEFGLKNYGPGVALYLQVRVVVSDVGRIDLKPLDRPVHLEEGEFLKFSPNSPLDGSDLISLVEEAGKCDQVEFYYSYVSQSGVREPIPFNNQLSRDDEEILSELETEADKPRRMDVKRIRQHCKAAPNNP